MARKVYHSVLSQGPWKIRHNDQTVSTHETQKDAEQAAMELGRRAEADGSLGQAVLHKGDGTIREERIYGKDPERTRG